MLIIGERINSTRNVVKKAIAARDANFILKEAKAQLEAGAHFIDIKCAMGLDNEVLDMDWVISVIQSGLKGVSICIDSPNYLAVDRALAVYKTSGELMINSITGEDSRIRHIVPLAAKHKAKLIALTMNEKGMPDTAEERYEIAKEILTKIKKEGFREEDLYFDPLIRPVSTEPKQADEFLKAIPLIKSLGGVKTICGLSNVSFGLPARSAINATFLVMAVQAGLDAAILDPLDKRVMSSLSASKALVAKDEYCAEYIRAFREGKLT